MADKEQRNQSDSSASRESQPYPSMDPRLLAVMYGMAQEDEINFLEYWYIIWNKRWFIMGFSFVVGVIVAVYSLTLPNIYRAEVLLAPVAEVGRNGSGQLSSLIGLGSLPSLAGVTLPSGGGVEENLAILSSREFLWKFIADEKLKPLLFKDCWDTEKKTWIDDDPKAQPSQWDAYRKIKSIMDISQDKKTNLVTVAIEWDEPEIAAKWANQMIFRVNKYLRQAAIERSSANLKYLQEGLARTQVADLRQTLFELMSQEQKKAMLANTQEQFAFRVLDAAIAPDKKTKPKRAVIVILSAIVSGVLSILGIFVVGSLRRWREKENL